MGKQSEKENKQVGEASGDVGGSPRRSESNSPKMYDNDTLVFISMAQELKDEGNKLFQNRDLEGAMLKFEKAIKLLPKNHIDVSYFRSSMAACYMQLGISEYPRAIQECNLALEVTPKYSKALLKRARCYEALNRLDLAFRDVSTVVHMEPNNIMALEILERVKSTLESRGLKVTGSSIELPPEYVEPDFAAASAKEEKDKTQKKKKKSKSKGKKIQNAIECDNDNGRSEEKVAEEKIEEKAENGLEEYEPEERLDEKADHVESVDDAVPTKEAKDKALKKKKSRSKGKKIQNAVECDKDNGKNRDKAAKVTEEAKAENGFEDYGANKRFDEVKEVVKEQFSTKTDQEVDGAKRNVKLVFGEDIRWATVPVNFSLLQLRQVIQERFPSSEAVLVKYRDQEGDLVTITCHEELRLAEASAESQGCLRLYLVEISPEHDPYFVKLNREREEHQPRNNGIPENGCLVKGKELKVSSCVEDWVINFAQLFKHHIGFESDRYMNVHDVGYECYADALEEMVTSEEAQGLFDSAGGKFQEMAALALLNCGNVHMSMARKKVFSTDDSSRGNIIAQIKSSHDWAQKEYMKAGEKYKEAVSIKEDFYEGFLALGQQQFEMAKLAWYHAISNNVDLEALPSGEVLLLYQSAEDNMEKGMQLLDASERTRETTSSEDSTCQLQKMGLKTLFKNLSQDETSKLAAYMRSQINLLWGSMFYERSMVEFKSKLPAWKESLQAAVEKLKLAGASPNDIAEMTKNHCSHGFKVQEVVKARSEMFDARKLQRGILSFRLEPLLRRRVSKVYHELDLP